MSSDASIEKANLTEKDETIEKIVWMLWHQGIPDAPLIVRNCHQSWVAKNPGWKVVVLDEHNLADYLDIDSIVGADRRDIPMAAMSDIIRINLLRKYGGVWADATCFCNQPLDDWLGEAAASGFFAFEGHRADTLMSSWFLAGARGNHLVERLCETVNAYWRENRFPEKPRQRIYSRLKKILNRNAWLTRFWFAYPVRKWLKVKPYFWFHYLFQLLLEKDESYASIWQATPRRSGLAAHILQQEGLLSPVSERARSDIDQRVNAVYKLNWKLHKFYSNYDPEDIPPDTVLGYLFHSHGMSPGQS